MNKEEQILSYLYDKIFLDVINSKTASQKAKNIINKTIMCLKQLPAKSMIQYVWNATYEEDNNGERADNILKNEGFITFQDIIYDFNKKFDDDFLNI